MSEAVHHSAYLIATDEANGGIALLSAATIGKVTAGVSRLPQVIQAKVGVPPRDYSNGNLI